MSRVAWLPLLATVLSWSCRTETFEPDLTVLECKMVAFYDAEVKRDFETQFGFLDPTPRFSAEIERQKDKIRNRALWGAPMLLRCHFHAYPRYHTRGRLVAANCFVMRQGIVYREFYSIFATYPSLAASYPRPFYIEEVYPIERADREYHGSKKRLERVKEMRNKCKAREN